MGLIHSRKIKRGDRHLDARTIDEIRTAARQLRKGITVVSPDNSAHVSTRTGGNVIYIEPGSGGDGGTVAVSLVQATAAGSGGLVAVKAIQAKSNSALSPNYEQTGDATSLIYLKE